MREEGGVERSRVPWGLEGRRAKGRIRAAAQLHRRVRIGNDRFGDWGVIDLRPSPVSPSFLSRGVGSVTHALGAHRVDDGYHDPYRSLNRN